MASEGEDFYDEVCKVIEYYDWFLENEEIQTLKATAMMASFRIDARATRSTNEKV